MWIVDVFYSHHLSNGSRHGISLLVIIPGSIDHPSVDFTFRFSVDDKLACVFTRKRLQAIIYVLYKWSWDCTAFDCNRWVNHTGGWANGEVAMD